MKKLFYLASLIVLCALFMVNAGQNINLFKDDNTQGTCGFNLFQDDNTQGTAGFNLFQDDNTQGTAGFNI